MTTSSPQQLVSYRRRGGIAGLDQRLTVFADGRVVLEDRRARAGAEAEATQEEIQRLSALVDAVPDEVWHTRLAALGRALLPRPHEAMRFEIRRGPRSIGGHAGRSDAGVAALIAALDELLARAVREGRRQPGGA